MLDAFGSLLDRPIIKKNSEPKYPLLIQMYEVELDDTKKMFDQQNAMLKVNIFAKCTLHSVVTLVRISQIIIIGHTAQL